jgi:hypothetical protein
MGYRSLPPTGKLRVWINNDFFLDAGDYETVVGAQGPEQRIHPPKITLFEQVLAYLKSAPDPGGIICPTRRQEGVAAAAVTLRWGSYLAVLLDRDKPKWNIRESHNTSHVSNEEMARINIEASTALAAWIAIFNEDKGGPAYKQLVNRALTYLPMPKMGQNAWPFMFGALAEPEAAAKLIQRHSPSLLRKSTRFAPGSPSIQHVSWPTLSSIAHGGWDRSRISTGVTFAAIHSISNGLASPKSATS